MSTQNELYSAFELDEDTLRNKVKFIKATRTGIPGKTIQTMIKLLENRDLITKVLGTHSRNLNRVYHKPKMKRDTSEEILDLIRLYGEAARIFGDLSLAKDWMQTPVTALSGETPESLCDTFEGREWVAQVLRKIEYGEFV